MSETKTCNKCGKVKELSEFHKSKNGKYGCKSTCKSCVSEQNRQKRIENPEKERKISRESGRRWRENHPGRSRELNQKSRAANYEKCRKRSREQSRQRRKENPQEGKEAQRRWRLNNIEKEQERQRQWYLNNYEKVRDKVHKRRARKQNNGPYMSLEEYKEWVKMQPKTCYYCGVDCTNSYQVDHFIPLAKGGLHQAHNLVISCPTCNYRKFTKDPEEFMEQLRKEKEESEEV